MPRKKPSAPQDDQEKLYTAFFALLSKDGWRGVTLPKIARASKIRLAALLQNYPDKYAVLEKFSGFLNRKLAAMDMEEAATLKERLFEVFMRRFELLQTYRTGLVRLMDDLKTDPLSAICLGVQLAPETRHALRLMMELAEFPSRIPDEVAMIGLKLVFLQTLRCWKNDESADLSATMATLDRALGRFISFFRLS